jgi:hypothetical protein
MPARSLAAGSYTVAFNATEKSQVSEPESDRLICTVTAAGQRDSSSLDEPKPGRDDSEFEIGANFKLTQTTCPSAVPRRKPGVGVGEHVGKTRFRNGNTQ